MITEYVALKVFPTPTSCKGLYLMLRLARTDATLSIMLAQSCTASSTQRCLFSQYSSKVLKSAVITRQYQRYAWRATSHQQSCNFSHSVT
jgi:hypothetical protein